MPHLVRCCRDMQVPMPVEQVILPKHGGECLAHLRLVDHEVQLGDGVQDSIS